MILSRIPAKEDLEEFLKNYSCKNEAINMEKLTASRHFIVEYSSKELYFGDMVNGRREGKGVLINDNSVFEGYFMCDDKVKGLEINHHGVYKGEYYLGKKEGNGEF